MGYEWQLITKFYRYIKNKIQSIYLTTLFSDGSDVFQIMHEFFGADEEKHKDLWIEYLNIHLLYSTWSVRYRHMSPR